jgi:hypothetical protein
MPSTTPRLDQSLALCDFLYTQVIGVPFSGLQTLLRDCKPLPGSSVSAYADALRRAATVRLPEAQLLQYDAQIGAALARINTQRATPIELKYYQYLAALNSAILLDRISHDQAGLRDELNRFVASANVLRRKGEHYPYFVADDLNKLAFWMATGSGKTLLMHLHYHQYLHYFPRPQNILLITPNEGLSEQHERELQASGIPCERWRGVSGAALPARDPTTVLIIEITKFRATSGAVSVSAASFTAPNLVFVDEGHKGIAGDAWVNVRDTLGKAGFSFEYSATFGQAVNATAKNRQEPLDVYAKAIAFDYSYRFFYGDGYGKDFKILTTPDTFDTRLTERFLLASLLTFYRQRADYVQQGAALAAYEIAPPLAMFVGSYVNAVSKTGAGVRSDVLDVVLFLQRCLHERSWVEREIALILDGRSELRKDGIDQFAEPFADLKREKTPEQIYADLLIHVFRAEAGASLSLVEITQADGEIGLRAGQQRQPFGVINIGDRREFLKLAADARPGLTITSDRFSASLFDLVNRPDSPVSIIIGSKKFIEGWNSWRVSSMGLLNIGRSEGSQIIQLFGRGVRLRGFGGSLQRSIRAESANPPPLNLVQPLQRLEQLNIFGVKADYMKTFEDYLRKEGVSTEQTLAIEVPVRQTHAAAYTQLTVPALRSDGDFAADERIELAADGALASVELRYKRDLATIASTVGTAYGLVEADREQTFSQQQLAVLDWNALYNAALQHKQREGYANLALSLVAVKAILHEPETHTLVGPPELLRTSDPDDIARVQSIAASVLLKYIDNYYKRRMTQWAAQRLEYRTVDAVSTLIPPKYTFKVAERNTTMADTIKQVCENGSLYTTQLANFPQIFIEQHIYQPLLTANGAEVKLTPTGLNPSEQKFATDLRTYLGAHPALATSERAIYLLRNPSKDKGIRFFGSAGFYPDFILWVLTPARHTIVFVDPKGLLSLAPNFQDEKVRLASTIKAYEAELQPASGPQIVLEAFLDSETRRHELTWQVPDGAGGLRQANENDYRDHHVLFQYDEDHIGLLFKLIGVST